MFNDSIKIKHVTDFLLHCDIVERQPDLSTGEWKYLFIGESHSGPLAVVVKLDIDNQVIIITVYLV